MQVRKDEENKILFHLYCVNSSVDKSDSEDAIEHLRVILEYPDLDSSDAKVFQQAISKLEGVIDVLDAVKEELGKTELSKIPVDPLADLPPGFGDRHPDDDETVTGLIKGKWVVHAWVNHHYSAIQVDIHGGRKASKGVRTGDRSISLAGDDWRPLVTEAVAEMRRRTGRPILTDVTQVYGVLPRVDFETDEGVDDSERGEIAEELADILSELEDAPLPPRVD